MVVGSPATAAISLEWNWRVAVAAVTAVAGLVTVAAWLVLPVMALTEGQLAVVGRGAHHHRNRRLVIVSLLTMIAVTGHYMSYTFFAVIVRDVVGVRGPDIAWLTGYLRDRGPVGDPAGGPTDGPSAEGRDHQLHDRAVDDIRGADCVGLAPAAPDSHGVDRDHPIALWGGTANAVSPMLQSAAMRAGADDPDGASGLYMAAFQVGIMAAPFACGLFYEHGMLMMLGASAALIGLGAVGMIAERHLFDVPSADRP